MKVAFFHGLESPARSEKNDILEELFRFENVYAPAMDYHNPELYNEVLTHLQENPVDLLIGSSMGGYFAHSLSSILNIPTLLFNPALHSRSFEPENVVTGNYKPSQSFVLGKNDTLIDPVKTLVLTLQKKYAFPVGIAVENIEHRIPFDIFRQHVSKYAK
jgi:predicted esterase YcpF (UPF0227 family)